MPDAISWAKGIAGGFPLGAIWVRDRVFTLEERRRRSRWRICSGPARTAPPLAGRRWCAPARSRCCAIIEEEGLLENARVLGAYAKEAIEGLGSPLIAEVRGLGLMLGIELAADFAARTGSGRAAARASGWWTGCTRPGC